MRRAEQLHEEILAQMDLSKEASDEELLELIHRILEEKSKEEFIPLGEKAILGRELFNAFRKLDILQELIEDEEITEIMINGTQPIFIERNGRIYETDKKFLSKGKLEDVVQQMVAGCNRVVRGNTDRRCETGGWIQNKCGTAAGCAQWTDRHDQKVSEKQDYDGDDDRHRLYRKRSGSNADPGREGKV